MCAGFVSTFWKSFTLTFTMLMAVGPICLTVINTTISRGILSGMAAGIGVAVADTVYIVTAGLAIDYAADVIKGSSVYIFGIIGSMFLIYLSVKFWQTNIEEMKSKEIAAKSYLKQFITLFVMTISGPTTVFTYAAIFSNFIGSLCNMRYVMIGGVCGTFSFYIILVSILSIIRKKMTIKVIKIINKASSIIIAIFGVIIMKESILHLLGK